MSSPIPFPRRALAPLVAPLLLLAGCDAGGASGADADPQADLLLLYTSNVQGFIEPCGCHAGKIGGIDRITGYVEDERAAHPETIFLDLGDLVARNVRPDPALAEQLPIKAEGFFEVWGKLGCDGLALGETDLVLGAERLKDLSERHGVPILCANLVGPDKQPVFAPNIVVERAGKKIGIFSVLAPKLAEMEMKDPHSVDVRKLAHDAGLKLTPWKQAARRQVRELSKTCDLILFASHLDYDLNREFAEMEPRLDLVFGGHWGEDEVPTRFIGNTPVLGVYVKGSRVGRVEWWWPDEDEFFRPGEAAGNGPLENLSERYALRTNLAVEQATYDDLEGREGSFVGKEWEEKRKRHRIQTERLQAAFDELEDFPRGQNAFAHNLVPMHFKLRRSELALQRIDQYHDELYAFWSERKQRRRHDPGFYVGADACVGCHPSQYDFWAATRHSRAIHTLRATSQDLDAECIGCHSVGYQLPGGFDYPNEARGMTDVQCAACHGPGGLHAAGGASFVEDSLILEGMGSCLTCHDHEHDPPFESKATEKLLAVGCPPLPRKGEGSPGLISAYLEAAAALESRSGPKQWRKITNAYVKAGAVEPSLAAAQRWAKAMPASVEARITLGECLLAVERFEEAVPHFRAVLDENPDLLRAWLGLGGCLLVSDPDGAVEAGMEAYSLAPHLVEPIEIVARAHKEAGRHEAARASVEAYLEQVPGARERLGPILDELDALASGG